MIAAMPRPLALSGPWARHLGAMAVAVAAILAIFRRDLSDIVHIWWTSTTYGHCLFILPVVGWLVWNRRRELARVRPIGWLPGVVMVAGGGALWLLGDAGGVALGRQLGLVAMVEGAIVATLGPNVARGLLFPLAYAFFMVPFGSELEPPLQDVTVAMVMPMLHLAGVPASVDGVLIHAGRYYFEVAEACSGAKFVIAMIAYGVLVANVCFTSWRRRAAFMAVCVVVPVLANGLRAFGTIYAAHLTSVRAATGLDHIVYGWIFFALVMAGVMAAAWRWFDRSPDAPAFDPAALSAVPRWRVETIVAAALSVAVAGFFPAWSHAVAGRAAPLPARIDLPVVPGWTRAPVDVAMPWQPFHPGADHQLFGRYRDAAGNPVDMAVAAYAGQAEGRKLAAFGTGALREADRWVRVADLPGLDGGRAIRIVAAAPGGTTVERIVVTWYRVGTVMTGDERRVKIATMKDRLSGGSQTAVALHLSAPVLPGRTPRDAAAAIARFAAALGPLGPAADRIATTPR